MTGGGDVEKPSPKDLAKQYSGMITAYQKELPGLISSYTGNIGKFSGAALADMQGHLPGVSAMVRDLNPEQSELLDKLNAQASSDLDLGADVDPALLRLAQQSVRARTQGTLGGTGRSGEFQEALGVSSFANDLRNQRRAFAGNVASLGYNTRTAPALNTLAGISAAGQGALLTPANSWGVMSNIYNGQVQSNIATANNATSLMNNSSQGFDSFAGTAAGKANLI